MLKKWNEQTLKFKLLLIVIISLVILSIVFIYLTINSAETFIFRPIQKDVVESFGRQGGNREVTRETIDILLNERRNEFITNVFFVVFGLVCIGSLIIYFVLSKAIEPLEKLSVEIKSLDENNIDMSLNVKSNSKEITSVIESFNNLTKRVANSFEQQKRFNANVAHELKTPLAIMKTNKQVFDMKEVHDIEEYKILTNVMEEQQDRLIDIVDTLLRMNDKNNIEKNTFELEGLINSIVSGFDIIVSQKKLNIVITGNCTIETDYNLLKRAVTNIVENAIKYSLDDGMININISDTYMEVIDFGIGIPPRELNKIFEPYYRVDDSRSRNSGGSGLGLSLTKQILSLLDMNITIESEKQTKVIVYFESVK